MMIYLGTKYLGGGGGEGDGGGGGEGGGGGGEGGRVSSVRGEHPDEAADEDDRHPHVVRVDHDVLGAGEHIDGILVLVPG